MGTTAGQPAAATSGPGIIGQPAGGGEPAAAGQPAAGTGGQPGGPGGAGQPGAAGVAGDFDRGALNPVLRDMNPGQINELFGALLRTRGEPAAPPPAAPAAPALPEVDVKNLMDPSHADYNPELAMKYVIQKNYGGLISDINLRSVKGMYGNFRNQIHDFAQFEDEIDRALAGRDPATLTERDVFGTYLTAKGMKALAAERQALAASQGRTAPAPSTSQPPVTTVELDAESKEMARLFFPNAQDPEAKYIEYMNKIGDGAYTLQVPIGDGKKA